MVTAFDPACVATGGQEAVDVGAFTENSREIEGSCHEPAHDVSRACLKGLSQGLANPTLFCLRSHQTSPIECRGLCSRPPTQPNS